MTSIPVPGNQSATWGFLQRYATKEQNVELTHTDLFGGRFVLSNDDIRDFFDLYSKDAGRFALGLVERRSNPIFPMIFDIDIPNDFTGDRWKLVKDILVCFKDYVIDPCLVALDHDDTSNKAQELVFDDQAISHRNNEKFHVVFPKILVNSDTGKAFVEHVCQSMNQFDYDHLDWTKIIDKCVVTGNGLRMLGSFKRETTQGFYRPCQVDWENLIVTNQDITVDSLELHSVRNTSTQGAIVFTDLEHGDSNTNTTSVAMGNVIVPYETLKTAVMALPDLYYGDGSYSKWIRIIWAIQSLAETGEYVDQGLALAHEFSQQAGHGYDARLVDRMYRASSLRFGKPRLGWKSLFAEVSLHAPAVATACTSQIRHIAPPATPEDWDSGTLANALADLVGQEVINISSFRFEAQAIRFELDKPGQGRCQGFVKREDGAVYIDGEYRGHIARDVNIDESMSRLHRAIPESARWVLNFTDEHSAELRNTDGQLQATINVHHAFAGSNTYLTLSVGGSRMGNAIVAQRSVDYLQERIREGVANFMLNHLGVTQAYFDRCVFNINLPEGEKRRPEGVLMRLLADTKPHLKDVWAFDNDAKTSSRNGLFHCDSTTKVWMRVNNVIVERELRNEFADLPGLTHQERAWVWTRRGVAAVREEWAALVLRQGFELQLDSNLDIFPMGGGKCLDMTTDTIRNITPQDMVSMTTGWIYDEDESVKYRADVEKMFGEIFPYEDERDMVLRYLAQQLSGRRNVKKMMCLTDRRGGNNGKSVIVKLLQAFSGRELAIADNKLLMAGSHDRGRDEHDSGLETYQGVRVAISEELKKTQRFAEGLVKCLTGGANTLVGGRKLGNAERYTYVWTALLIAVFNEGDIPQFDLTDQAFVRRLIIAPMRSKFIPGYTPRPDDEEFTFAADEDITNRFPIWRSAILDILRSKYDPRDISEDDLPEGMKRWRADTVDEENEVADWLSENVQKSEDVVYDVLSIGDLFERYKTVTPASSKTLKKSLFKSLAVAWLTQNGWEVLGGDPVTVRLLDGTTKNKRNVVRGIKLN
jgi:phage/plasmid-associated DNA primase